METKVCNKCKYLMNENSQFCENCGTKYETVLSKVENLQIKHNCISCKKEFSSESIFCPHCGIKNSLLNVDVIKTTKDKDIDNETKEKKVTNNNDVILFGIAVFLFVVLLILNYFLQILC
jgi:RNA polymerase subunit RPABC4/transcription elongation factor Spt4